jgi:hypothetical protein
MWRNGDGRNRDGHKYINNYIKVQGLWCRGYGKQIADDDINSNDLCQLMAKNDSSWFPGDLSWLQMTVHGACMKHQVWKQ